MKKVLIKKSGVITHQALFETQEQANIWIQNEETNKSFGKQARWVSEERIQLEGEDIALSDQMMIEPIMGKDVKLYHFPAQYLIEISDVTAQVTAENKVLDRAKKRAFGEALIDKISAINDSKNLSVEQVDAFMSNALITALREHLWAGNISTFVSKLQSSDVSAFFTTQEKASVVSECQTFLASLGG
jgi:hypothetical protein